MPGDRDDSYGEPMRESPREPLQPTAEQRAAWREMGREKFRDSEHQRYAGRHGYQATAERYGREFASDLLANHRRAQPTRPEREMVGLLKELGAEEGRDYQREYKVSPGMYADFAIPDRKLAIEVHGGAHQAAFFLEKGMEARESRRTETYTREGWAVHVVTDRDLREGRDETCARMRETLAVSAGSRR